MTLCLTHILFGLKPANSGFSSFCRKFFCISFTLTLSLGFSFPLRILWVCIHQGRLVISNRSQLGQLKWGGINWKPTGGFQNGLEARGPDLEKNWNRVALGGWEGSLLGDSLARMPPLKRLNLNLSHLFPLPDCESQETEPNWKAGTSPPCPYRGKGGWLGLLSLYNKWMGQIPGFSFLSELYLVG